MKTLLSLLCLLSALIPFCDAEQSALLSAIEALPNCALECLTTAIAVSPCQLTNQTCICMDSTLQASVELCVTKSCTVRDSLVTKNTTATLCHAPVRDRAPLLRSINIGLGVISAACVLIRILYKLVVTVYELGLDDYFILLTLVCGVPQTIITDRGTTANGLGKDIWTLKPTQVTNFIRAFYVMEVLYFAIVAILKLSLLFFYHRIFPGANVRRVIWGTIAFDVLFGVAFVVVAIFQCRPIGYYWTSWDGQHSGTCININALGWSNAAISITLDLWMLAIPLSQLVHLKLAWKKKVGVGLMFCVGTFVTVVSILRLQSLVHFASSTNPTWDQWAVNVWSTVEINVGIICACMPAIRVLLVRLFPRVLGTTAHTNQQYHAKYGTNKASVQAKPSNSSRGESSLATGNKIAITYTQTFEVQHGDNDMTRLVEMDDLGAKGKPKSSSSSQVSA
ncbi:hypothetical protein K491DRAFT_601347 [Lophiostoma macrostomum CBS 122681]|uniref:CFEM domain-containing protein n=1 Tax=Lophiostoma macrostomum CBS 122681 TaxID=1314788 RepID=A0A6A6T5R4_9PLEO|nr:hypothetical protein K491DRAFT_601347 [Lophiostoma macrostomum CBS 122681]